MKTYYSLVNEKGADDAKNPENYYINGAFRPEEEENLSYSSISIREMQLYAVTEGEGAREALAKIDAPSLFRENAEFSAALPEDAALAVLALWKNSLLAYASRGGRIYRIRSGRIDSLDCERTAEGDTLPGDLYLLVNRGLQEALPEDRLLQIVQETDRIQEIAGAVKAAAAEEGYRKAATVIAVLRDR